MDVLFMFMGALCLAEGIDLFTGNDFLMFVGSTKKEDYDLKKVFQVEKWIFLVDAACSLGVEFNRFPDVVETILLVVFGATLAAHVYVFKSKKFRKER
ncbi:MAG: hypothetical protein LUK37_06395 [Clostridia bacterium]|nr:hypothetical protein [Clostridia bacterium]